MFDGSGRSRCGIAEFDSLACLAAIFILSVAVDTQRARTRRKRQVRGTSLVEK
jgi:hypothetical protein